MGMAEYKIERGDDSIIQTKLNQWRHDYYIDVLHMVVTLEGEVVILIRRERKDGGDATS